MYDLKKQLIKHEGIRKKPYYCTAGKLTVGVGRNIEDNDFRKDEALLIFSNNNKYDISIERLSDIEIHCIVIGLISLFGLRDDEINLMLDNDIVECEKLLQANIKGWVTLHQERQNVLINMCFNLGITRLLRFKKMFKAISESNWDTTADEMLDSKWARQVGDRAIELSTIMTTC